MWTIRVCPGKTRRRQLALNCRGSQEHRNNLTTTQPMALFVYFLKATTVFFKFLPNLEFKFFPFCFWKLKILDIFVNNWSDPFRIIQKACHIMNLNFLGNYYFHLIQFGVYHSYNLVHFVIRHQEIIYIIAPLLTTSHHFFQAHSLQMFAPVMY